MKYKIKATDKVLPGKKTWSLHFEGFRRAFNRDTGVLECEATLEPANARQLAADGYDVSPVGAYVEETKEELPDLEPLPDREAEDWSETTPRKKKTRKHNTEEND